MIYWSINRLSYYFYKIAQVGYDKFREEVEERSKKNPYPFSKWFGDNGRTYIDFKPDDNGTELDEKDTSVISFLESNGYKNIDYINGYAEKDGRNLRIGKVLNNIRDKVQKGDGVLSNRYSVEMIDDYLNTFINSKNRSLSNQKKGFKIVFFSKSS
jgi:hypothetical protein